MLDTGARGDARNAAGGEEVLETEPEVRRSPRRFGGEERRGRLRDGVWDGPRDGVWDGVWDGVRGWGAGWAVDAGAGAAADADFCRLSASEQLSTCLGSQVGPAIHIRRRKFRSGRFLRR